MRPFLKQDVQVLLKSSIYIKETWILLLTLDLIQFFLYM